MLTISFGTYSPIILQYFLQSQSVSLFPLDTLHLGNRVWEAHPRMLDEARCAISWEETLQLRHLVGARVITDRLRDGMFDS